MMRGWLAVVIAVVCSSMIAEADTKEANAANKRGYALHEKKKYAEAAVEYKKAIIEDSAHLLAHYNLACVASLTKDADTAKEHLRWIADRATWDDASAAVMKKAAKDKDLVWLRKLDQEGSELAGGMKNTQLYAVSFIDHPKDAYFGAATTDAKLLKTMASAPGKHEQACSADTFSTRTFVEGGTAAVNLGELNIRAEEPYRWSVKDRGS